MKNFKGVGAGFKLDLFVDVLCLGRFFIGVMDFLALEIDGGAAYTADIETVGAGLLNIGFGGDADNTPS